MELNRREVKRGIETNNMGDCIDGLRISKWGIDSINGCMIGNKKKKGDLGR